MSVLVKGVQMPEKCGSCDLFHAEYPMHCTVVKGYKTVGAPYGMPRPEWCPLVELPETCDTCKHSTDVYDSGFCDGCTKAQSNLELMWEGEG